MLTGLYCNSLMATLNSRAVLGVGRINYPQNRLSRILPMTGGHGTTVLSHSDACSEVTDSLADATSRRRRTSSTSNTRSFSPGLIFWQDRPNFNIVTPGGQKTGGRNALPSMHMLSKLNRPLTRPGGTGKRLPGNIFISRSTVARSEGPARDALVEDCNESVDEIKVGFASLNDISYSWSKLRQSFPSGSGCYLHASSRQKVMLSAVAPLLSEFFVQFTRHFSQTTVVSFISVGWTLKDIRACLPTTCSSVHLVSLTLISLCSSFMCPNENQLVAVKHL